MEGYKTKTVAEIMIKSLRITCKHLVYVTSNLRSLQLTIIILDEGDQIRQEMPPP